MTTFLLNISSLLVNTLCISLLIFKITLIICLTCGKWVGMCLDANRKNEMVDTTEMGSFYFVFLSTCLSICQTLLSSSLSVFVSLYLCVSVSLSSSLSLSLICNFTMLFSWDQDIYVILLIYKNQYYIFIIWLCKTRQWIIIHSSHWRTLTVY